MTPEKIVRERQLWIAIVAVLVTASAWLALINAALLLKSAGLDLASVMIAARIVGKALLTMVGLTRPFLAAAIVGVALVIAWIAVGRERDLGQEGVLRV